MGKKESSLVTYGDFSAEDAEQEEQELEKLRGPTAFVDMSQPGKYRFRFLPPRTDAKWKRVTYVHYMEVPGVGRVSYTCPKLEAKKSCKTCTLSAKLMATDNEVDSKRGKKMQPTRRILCNVIVRGQEDQGPKVYAFGITVEKALVQLRKDEELGGAFVDPIRGFDVIVVRKGLGMDTKYEVHKGKVCPLSDDTKEMNEWITGQHNLERHVRLYSEEQIQQLLNGERPTRSEEDEEETPRKKASSIADDLEDDDDELDDE